jgi:hypothetical protein
MAHEWITAATALRYLSDELHTYGEQRALCVRAHSGLIASQAETLIWKGEERQRCTIPKEFWWAEGGAALNQNWTSGDFSTWIDQKIEVKAFGVSFDFLAVIDMMPAERRAEGLGRISVASNPDWIRAQSLIRMIHAQTRSPRASEAIIEACALGQLVARTTRASGHTKGPFGNSPNTDEWAAIEWDVPISFWRDFMKPRQAIHDWSLGKVRGQSSARGTRQEIALQGLHFHRSGLALLGLAKSEADDDDAKAPVNSGRKPKYDWTAATLAVFGQIHRGDFKPETQAEIERALQTRLARGDREPSESTVRPYAKRIWEEIQQP